jgi:hypothetical protein
MCSRAGGPLEESEDSAFRTAPQENDVERFGQPPKLALDGGGGKNKVATGDRARSFH